jgi:hypothetical protein
MVKPVTKHRIGFSFIASLLFIMICFGLLPTGLLANNGLSFYGTHQVSLLPFIIAIGFYAGAMLYAAQLLAIEYATPILEKTGVFMAGCLAMLAVTPYSLDPTVHAIHDSFGSGLFTTQMLLSIWLTIRKRELGDILLVSIQFVAGVAAFFSLFNYWHLEVLGQLIFQLTFVAILWRHLDDTTH